MSSDRRLTCDPNRLALPEVGIAVRAAGPDGEVRTYDVTHLDRVSLLAFLRSRDGDNVLAENVVGVLLGHGHLHVPPEATP